MRRRVVAFSAPAAGAAFARFAAGFFSAVVGSVFRVVFAMWCLTSLPDTPVQGAFATPVQAG